MYGDDRLWLRLKYLGPTALCIVVIIAMFSNMERFIGTDGRLNVGYYLVLMICAVVVGVLLGIYLRLRDDHHRFIGTVMRTWTEVHPRYPRLPDGPTEEVFLFTLAETGEDRYWGVAPGKFEDEETPIVPGLRAIFLRSRVNGPNYKYTALPMAKRYVPTGREQRILDEQGPVAATTAT